MRMVYRGLHPPIPGLLSSETWLQVIHILFLALLLTSQIGALIGHCIFFWGPQIVKTVKDLREGGSPDRHHLAMKRYKDTPWWWYTIIMGIAFVFGLVVVLKSNVGLGAGGFVAALAVGAVIAPFVSVQISRDHRESTLIVAECYSLFSIWRRYCNQPVV